MTDVQPLQRKEPERAADPRGLVHSIRWDREHGFRTICGRVPSGAGSASWWTTVEPTGCEECLVENLIDDLLRHLSELRSAIRGRLLEQAARIVLHPAGWAALMRSTRFPIGPGDFALARAPGDPDGFLFGVRLVQDDTMPRYGWRLMFAGDMRDGVDRAARDSGWPA